MIKRYLESVIQSRIGKGKAIVLYGARQVGKTTLLEQIFGKDIPNDKILWLDGDNQSARDMFKVASIEAFKPLLGKYHTIIIDEAQRITDIGLKLKILQDNYGKDIQFVATGSSSFELANQINEPLTGRKVTFWLSAPSAQELVDTYGIVAEKSNLDQRLIFGSYPEVVIDPENARETISDLAGDSLFRDVLNLSEIIKTDKLASILKALALQIGNQVSMTEIAGLVGIDRKTVEKYISLLEQSFIIFRLPSYSRNLRNELKFSQKIYFYDTGIRNALINDFRPLDLRNDAGSVFENYIVSELKKKYHKDNLYFWRNTDQQEIDVILEKDGVLSAFEIKLTNKSAKLPNSFATAYSPDNFTVITKDNYLEVLTD